MIRRPPRSTLFPSTTLSRSLELRRVRCPAARILCPLAGRPRQLPRHGEDQPVVCPPRSALEQSQQDRKSTRLNSSHLVISYAVFCLKKKKNVRYTLTDN